ncbi:MAG: HlyD family secretion protein [Deltaproteobacteria bacterium]
MDKRIRTAIIIVLAAAAGFAVAGIVKRSRPDREIPVSGNLEADEVRISFRSGGKMIERSADEGDRIKTGQLLARLDTDELGKIKAQAEAAVAAQDFAFRRAHDDYVRAENLLREGAVAQQARDNARTQVDAAKANLDNLKAQLDLAQTRLGFAQLVSPIDGFITVRSAEAGEVLAAGSPVFTAVDLNDIWLTAYVKETDLGRVKLGQTAFVSVDSYPGKRYRGSVTFISSQAEFTPKQIQTPEERVKLVYRVKIQLSNPDLELKPGMPAEGVIEE